MTYDRGTGCQHPAWTDEDLETAHEEWRRTWGDSKVPFCEDCREWLFILDDTYIVDTPPGDGAD